MPRLAWRATAVLIAAASAVLAVTDLLAVWMRRGGIVDDAVYFLEPTDLPIAAACALLVVAGAIVAIVTRRPDIWTTAALTLSLLLVGLASFAAAGIGWLIVLPVALLPGLLLARQLSRSTQAATLPLVAAATAAVGLLGVTAIADKGPQIRCPQPSQQQTTAEDHPDEPRPTPHPPDPPPAGAEVTVTTDGDEFGAIRIDGDAYQWECRQGQLVRFEKVQPD